MEAVSAAEDLQTGREAGAVTDDRLAREWAWVQKARKGNRNAFEALYRLHVERIYGLCLRMTGNVSEAEDCTQEAFIQAWRQLRRFRGDSAFGTWLHRVAVNAVLGRMRKFRREQDRLQAVAEVSPAPPPVADGSDLRDIENALAGLPSGARHVFVLHSVYGYSHEETGTMLGIASGTSKAQLHRARRLLAEQLDMAGAAEPGESS